LLLAASCGFAGPLLVLAGAESGGVHLFGGTSTGKSTALFIGASVCGGGGSGFVQSWRSTLNGLEAIAEGHNDATLFLDELAQVDAKEAADTAYMLGNGQGKNRMSKGIAACVRYSGVAPFDHLIWPPQIVSFPHLLRGCFGAPWLE
jgi:putative DNA primase/helicase